MKCILFLLVLLLSIQCVSADNIQNIFRSDLVQYHELNDANDATCINFTVHRTGYIENISTYIVEVGTSPEYQYGLKTGRTGSWLVWENKTITSTSYVSINLSNYSVTANDEMCFCIAPVGTPDSSNYVRSTQLSPLNVHQPFDEVVSNYEVWFFDTAWVNQTTKTPHFVMEYNDSVTEGQPNYYRDLANIYGDTIRGEQFLQYGTTTIKNVSAVVERGSNVPNGSLYFELRNSTGTGIIRTCELVNSSTITTSFVKYESTFSSSYELQDGTTYTIYLRAPDANATALYKVAHQQTQAAHQTLSYNSTNAKYIYSTTNGSSSTSFNTHDIYFVLEEYTSAAPSNTLPIISSYAPTTPNSTYENVAATYNATINQSNSNNEWLINGTRYEWDNTTNSPAYTNSTWVNGTYNLTLISHNSSDNSLTDSQTWIVTVLLNSVDITYRELNYSNLSANVLIDISNKTPGLSEINIPHTANDTHTYCFNYLNGTVVQSCVTATSEGQTIWFNGSADRLPELDGYFINETLPSAPIITLLSMTPSEICQNCTGNLSILYGISHNSIGLNNTSVSFIYRNYDYDCACSNHSIRPPNNNLATLWDLDGRILRAANRNESLNFENNATITGGDDYTWSGLDENNSRLTIVPVNSTYTKVYINGTIHDVMPQMWYLDRTDLQEAPKTSIGVHKFNNVLIKFWNFEIFQGNTDFLGVGYTDTYLNPNPIFQPLDANPVNFYYVNSSYDPAIGGDPLTSGYSVYMGSLNASGWVDHIYSPHINSNYVRGFIDNNILETYLNTTNISYLYFTSNTPSSKPYYINMTDVASSTNVSFANTNVLWAGNTPPYAAQAYTPNIWFAFMKLNISLDQKLYVADNNDQWSNSTMNRTNISSGLFPPTKPSFYSFHNGFTDYDMNGTYHDTIQIQVSASSDPDGGTVTHNITLHYGNDTYVATINGSAVAEDGVYTNVTFNTTLYYSQTENYTLRVVATDDESETATTWLGVNFSLDGSPRIISYSPGTPIYSREGENQTFSITTNILGNVTWYIDSVEIFNETLVTYSSYSNSTASLGYHNVTVITTNINGTNSMKWDWTVRTRLWSLVVDSVVWGISVAQYLVSNIGIVITTAFSLICILILAMLIGAALSVTKLIYR